MKMSSDFNFTDTSWFLGNVRLKPHFNTQFGGNGLVELDPWLFCQVGFAGVSWKIASLFSFLVRTLIELKVLWLAMPLANNRKEWKIFQPQSCSRGVLEFAPLFNEGQTRLAGITKQPKLPVRAILSVAVSISLSLHKRASSITTL